MKKSKITVGIIIILGILYLSLNRLDFKDGLVLDFEVVLYSIILGILIGGTFLIKKHFYD